MTLTGATAGVADLSFLMAGEASIGVGAGESDKVGLRFLFPVPEAGRAPVLEDGVEGVATFMLGGGSVGARAREGASYIPISLFTFSSASSYIFSSAALRSPTVGSRRTVSMKLCHSCVLAVGQQPFS